jgi:glucose/arabinose dehydrogenase
MSRLTQRAWSRVVPIVVGLAVASLAMAAPTVGRTPDADPAGTPPDYRLRTVLSGYTRPDYVTSDGSDQRLFVVQQSGKIKVAKRASVLDPWRKAGTFLDITHRVLGPATGGPSGEEGLLGLAFHPEYADNGLFYVFYTRLSSDAAENEDGDTVIAEYQRETNLRADPDSGRVVLRQVKFNDLHYGGWMSFGPDGYMYVAMGDDGRGSRARAIGSRLGKILRFDPVDPDGSGPADYSEPPDNPYVGVPGNDLVWSRGLRNPFRPSHDRLTGDLWIGDVGSATWEEIDRGTAPDAGKGVDYGWPLCEGDHPFQGSTADCGPAPNTTKRPVVEFRHSVPGEDNCAVTGGYVYRGLKQPALFGRYFFSDWCSGRIWAIPTDHRISDPLPTPLETPWNVVSFGEDGLGELYVVDFGGRILRLVED